MKIIIYTITECPFSKQEKEYLSSHGLAFEEKNLETNREFLTEMLAVGSNFAGTPVTKIEKDDGQIAVLKGFTAAEFDKTLGFTAEPAPVKVVEDTSVKPVEPVEPATQQPASQVETAPVIQEPSKPSAPQPEVPQPVVPQPPTPDPAMASVLNTLEQQAQVSPPAAPVTGAPVIPDPKF